MKTKLLLLIVALFSFAASCEPEEVQQAQVEENCECRKMFYENQVVNYGFQFVYTHRGEWEIVPVSIKNSGVLQPNGFIWTGFTVIDDTHNYRWECKNE